MARLPALILILLACATASAQETPRPKTAPVAIIAPAVTVLPGGFVTSVPSNAPGAKSVSPLAELMRKLGEPFSDVTAETAAGRLDLSGTRALIIASGALGENEGRIGRALWDARRDVADFVEKGGVLVVFTAPGDAGALAFLPGVTQASIEPLTHSSRVMPSPEHLLVAGRHTLAPHNLGAKPSKPGPGALYPGGCYGVYMGLVPVVALDERGRYPILLDGAAGRGRVILIHLSPDRAFSFGAEDEKISATLIVENVLAVVHGTLGGDVVAPKPRPDRAIRGTVFEDSNGNGVRDPGERALAGLDVSDGDAIVKTDAEGNYYLPLDCYSEFVWVVGDLATHQGPFWRRIPPAGSTVDIGLAPRKTPLGAACRIAHVVDTGALYNPDDKDDPELSWALGEVARIAPRPDLLVVAGDTTTREMRRATLAKAAGSVERLSVFVGGPKAPDPVAERDAWARTFGPTAWLAKLGGREVAAVYPKFIEGRLSGRLLARTAGRVTFEGASYRGEGFSGETLSFRRRGVATPPSATLVDVAGATSRAESRLLGVTGLLQGVQPAADGTTPPGPLSVRVVTADTAAGTAFPLELAISRIARRDDRLVIEEPSLGEYRIVPAGRLTRVAEFKVPFMLDPAYYVLHLAGMPGSGTALARHLTFAVPGAPPPAPAFGAPWYSTGAGDSREGAGESETLLPPLYLSGVAGLGPLAPGAAPAVFSDVILVPGQLPAVMPDTAAHPGLPMLARRMDVPFACVPQGRYELKGDHAELVTGPVLRFEFGIAKPDPARTRLVVGGDILAVVDERGPAWGFGRTRGAEVKEGAFDAKTALESLKWQTDLLPGCRRPATTPLELYTGVECVEIGSGHVRWSWDRYALRERSAAVSGKSVVATGVLPPGGNSKFEARNSKPEARAGEGPSSSNFEFRDSSFASRQMVVCFDADTGRVIWEKALADVHPLDDAGTPAATIVKGVVFLGSADGVMRALKLGDGAEIWNFKTGDSVLPLGPGNFRSGRIVSQALVTDACVFFGGCDGRFYALDRRKGTLLWSYDLGLPVTGSPALSGNTLYVSDWDGNVYSFTSLAVKKGKKQ